MFNDECSKHGALVFYYGICWYRGENTDTTEKEESYHFKIPRFLFVLKTPIIIYRVSYGRNFDYMGFYENHILQSYSKHSTCMTCLTRKRNVLSTDNKHSEYACSKSAILRNQLSTETTCNFLKIRCVNYWVKVNYQFRCLWNVTSFNASFFLL